MSNSSRSYEFENLTIEFVDDNPTKTQESMNKLAQLYASVLEKSPDMVYLNKSQDVALAYGKMIKLCFEARKLQDAASKAFDANQGELFVTSFKAARNKFKEVHDLVKSQIVSKLNVVPPITDEIKAKLDSKAEGITKSHAKIIELKEFGDTLWNTTQDSNKRLIKLKDGILGIASDLKSGKLKPGEKANASAQVAPASSSPQQARQPQGVPSVHDAKKEKSKLKAAELNRLSGGGGVANNPNSKKSG